MKFHSPLSKLNAEQIRFRVTGQVIRNRHITYVDDVPVGITFSELEFILHLVSAKLRTIGNPTLLGRTKRSTDPSERAALHQCVRRLRREIDRATSRPGLGARFIRHAERSAYYLGVPADCIVVDDGIAELADLFPILINGILNERSVTNTPQLGRGDNL